MEFRQRVGEAERLVDVLSEADGAVVVGTGTDQTTAGRQQFPATGDVGEVLLLVFGEQHQAEIPTSALEAW